MEKRNADRRQHRGHRPTRDNRPHYHLGHYKHSGTQPAARPETPKPDNPKPEKPGLEGYYCREDRHLSTAEVTARMTEATLSPNP